nr:MAG TPA: hypothetical protein [Caudoviricetes sp.]
MQYLQGIFAPKIQSCKCCVSLCKSETSIICSKI